VYYSSHGEKCKVICAKILVNFMELAGPQYRDRSLMSNLLYFSDKWQSSAIL